MPASKVTITRPSNYHEYLEEYESGTIQALSPAAVRTKKMCPGMSFAKDDLGRDYIDVRSSSERMHGWFVM